MHERGELIVAGRRVSDIGALLRECRTRWGVPGLICCDRWREAELREHLDRIDFPLTGLVIRGQGYRDGGEDVRGSSARPSSTGRWRRQNPYSFGLPYSKPGRSAIQPETHKLSQEHPRRPPRSCARDDSPPPPRSSPSPKACGARLRHRHGGCGQPSPDKTGDGVSLSTQEETEKISRLVV